MLSLFDSLTLVSVHLHLFAADRLLMHECPALCCLPANRVQLCVRSVFYPAVYNANLLLATHRGNSKARYFVGEIYHCAKLHFYRRKFFVSC